ncbi:unnamed protein product [Arctia plantaginis]|uniref:Uncharacterized protein n=1 Tax=Arctia plantaginis TaxID=874455 RepID=A0A8S1A0Z6_ARCPL|nr:unnamed protein product [Arctia plantaginis]
MPKFKIRIQLSSNNFTINHLTWCMRVAAYEWTAIDGAQGAVARLVQHAAVAFLRPPAALASDPIGRVIRIRIMWRFLK